MKKLILLFLIASCCSCKMANRTVLGVDTSPEWLSNTEIVKEFNKRKYQMRIVSFWIPLLFGNQY
ncbi:hypothetical protein ABGT15_13915 [Flavobacterium enshiense]|uniref:hypothetical protein n=1 Tax=Flavobacterium enshiense TaxID=1341165 RepID=UPI00345D75D3